MLLMQQELFIFKKSVSQLHSAVYRNLKHICSTTPDVMQLDDTIHLLLAVSLE